MSALIGRRVWWNRWTAVREENFEGTVIHVDTSKERDLVVQLDNGMLDKISLYGCRLLPLPEPEPEPEPEPDATVTPDWRAP